MLVASRGRLTLLALYAARVDSGEMSHARRAGTCPRRQVWLLAPVSVPDLDWQLVPYAGAMHAFTLPDANAPEHGAQFQDATERRSWEATKAFLTETIG